MNSLTRLTDRVALLMYWLGGVLIVAMMLIVVADVAARGFFSLTDGQLDLTFVGGIELVKFSLLFSMLLAFPHAVDKGQIVVDLFTQQMNAARLRFFTGGYTLGFGLLGAAWCWRFTEAAHSARQTGELTQDLLLPMSAIYQIASLALAVLALRALLVGVNIVMGTHAPEQEHHS
ncbi:TRAP transporter small permease subunit [Oceanimonas doudoroffii]|uniref:TRAP transporter small permease protein n=1 Tax=Oceanimonas doudoroffii TaxID=84158 RepID=A0A233RGT9_9GAMM|nr:TRAP transporter small permease subunit [Oceanimonas doudoroffii]OXY82612.1 hypothetical protein B6S08_03570 [Oceanimonas doudoroffii]